ncbi:MAG: hypothetical protein NTZ80_04150, partial [Patescibacteria group bacterium]|nr:hypothetical protein [Patescibacteria group bacterium]
MSVKRKPGLSCKAKSKLSNPKVTPREIKVQAEVKPAENIEFIAAAHAYDLYEIQESAKQHPDKVDEIKAVALKLALDALGYAFEKRYVPGGHSQKIV